MLVVGLRPTSRMAAVLVRGDDPPEPPARPFLPRGFSPMASFPPLAGSLALPLLLFYLRNYYYGAAGVAG